MHDPRLGGRVFARNIGTGKMNAFIAARHSSLHSSIGDLLPFQSDRFARSDSRLDPRTSCCKCYRIPEAVTSRPQLQHPRSGGAVSAVARDILGKRWRGKRGQLIRQPLRAVHLHVPLPGPPQARVFLPLYRSSIAVTGRTESYVCLASHAAMLASSIAFERAKNIFTSSSSVWWSARKQIPQTAPSGQEAARNTAHPTNTRSSPAYQCRFKRLMQHHLV